MVGILCFSTTDYLFECPSGECVFVLSERKMFFVTLAHSGELRVVCSVIGIEGSREIANHVISSFLADT